MHAVVLELKLYLATQASSRAFSVNILVSQNIDKR